MIADRFRKGGMLLAHFAKWSEPDPHGASVLEQAPGKNRLAREAPNRDASR
jgi:hypothetical protein